MDWKDIKLLFAKEREKENDDIKSQSWYFDPDELSDSDKEDSPLSEEEYEKLGWGKKDKKVKNHTNNTNKMLVDTQINEKEENVFINLKKQRDIKLEGKTVKSNEKQKVNLKCYNIDEDEISQVEFQPISGETLYDENIDEKNEDWVRNNLRSYLQVKENNKHKLQNEIDIIHSIEKNRKY